MPRAKAQILGWLPLSLEEVTKKAGGGVGVGVSKAITTIQDRTLHVLGYRGSEKGREYG